MFKWFVVISFTARDISWSITTAGGRVKHLAKSCRLEHIIVEVDPFLCSRPIKDEEGDNVATLTLFASSGSQFSYHCCFLFICGMVLL